MSVLLLKQAVPPSEGGKTWNNEYAFADQAAVCSRGCAKPRARFDLPSFFSPPLRSAVNHAKLGESIAQRCWTLTQSATEHCEDCALCFLPSRSREEKGITAQREPISASLSSHNLKNYLLFFHEGSQTPGRQRWMGIQEVWEFRTILPGCTSHFSWPELERFMPKCVIPWWVCEDVIYTDIGGFKPRHLQIWRF